MYLLLLACKKNISALYGSMGNLLLTEGFNLFSEKIKGSIIR